MSGIMKQLKLLRIRSCARYIARNCGKQLEDGYIYDDGKLRIAFSRHMTTIFYPNEHNERKMVFSYSLLQHDSIFYDGKWEHEFAKCYNSLKNTAG